MSFEDPRYILGAFAGGLLTVHLASTSWGSPSAVFLILCVAGTVAYFAIERARQDAVAGTTGPGGGPAQLASITEIATKALRGVMDSTLDTDMYTLRNLAPIARRPLLHLIARPALATALAGVARTHLHRSRGAVWRMLACLEDFFARYDSAMVDDADPDRARRSMRTLLDTRAEALNVMHTIAFALPESTPAYEQLQAARHLVRRTTQRCLAVLANRRRAALRGVEWAPPYALDPRKDANYHIHY